MSQFNKNVDENIDIISISIDISRKIIKRKKIFKLINKYWILFEQANMFIIHIIFTLVFSFVYYYFFIL